MNLCKDCKHCEINRFDHGGIESVKCRRPHAVLGHAQVLYAFPERNASGHCGPRGHFFEAIPVVAVEVDAPKPRKPRASKPVAAQEGTSDGQE